jgi:hypothetical protein
MARPTKLTPETIKKLCEAIRLGAPYEHACNYAGIGFSTFNRWREKAENSKSGKFWQFWQDIKKAEGDATKGWLKIIEDAAKEGNWPAAAWKLERRYPTEFGKRIQQKIESQNIEIDLSDLTDDQLKRLANGENIASILSEK